MDLYYICKSGDVDDTPKKASIAPEDDISAEDLKFVDCLVMLVNYLQNSETQLNNFSF